MTSTERYRQDPEYRKRTIERAQHNHDRNKTSQTYRELTRTRKTLWQLRESVSNYRAKVKATQQRIARLETRKEILELAFGQERASKKRRTSI